MGCAKCPVPKTNDIPNFVDRKDENDIAYTFREESHTFIPVCPKHVASCANCKSSVGGRYCRVGSWWVCVTCKPKCSALQCLDGLRVDDNDSVDDKNRVDYKNRVDEFLAALAAREVCWDTSLNDAAGDFLYA